MKRKIYKQLLEWKSSSSRIPLILVGARQVGKTYIINEFGKNEYSNVIYCNLEQEAKIRDIFNIDLVPSRIITELENNKNVKINHQDTLIILDEIQACPAALTSLKYFNEQANQYHIIASGSLLGVALNRGGYSYPVGKVQTIHLYPFDFEEFLIAINQEKLIDLIKYGFLHMTPLSKSMHEKCLDLYKKYLFIGGMPKAIETYVNTNNDSLVREKQNEIIQNYLADMSKYNSAINANKSRLIFSKISKQLAKENKKFKYSLLKTGARASEYEYALNWICTAGLTKQLFRLQEVKLPLNAYSSSDDFKLYLNDVGLLCSIENVSQLEINEQKLSEFIGGLTENYVFNQLNVNGFETFYWTSKHTAEVDFIIKDQSNIIPIEVKSNTNNHSQSLNLFVNQYSPSYSIRISARNFGFENKILSIPLYSLFCLKSNEY